jgi:hypothetical protein
MLERWVFMNLALSIIALGNVGKILKKFSGIRFPNRNSIYNSVTEVSANGLSVRVKRKSQRC